MVCLCEDLNDEKKNMNMCSNVRMLVKMLANMGKPCQHRDVSENVNENVGLFLNMLKKKQTFSPTLES